MNWNQKPFAAKLDAKQIQNRNHENDNLRTFIVAFRILGLIFTGIRIPNSDPETDPLIIIHYVVGCYC